MRLRPHRRRRCATIHSKHKTLLPPGLKPEKTGADNRRRILSCQWICATQISKGDLRGAALGYATVPRPPPSPTHVSLPGGPPQRNSLTWFGTKCASCVTLSHSQSGRSSSNAYRGFEGRGFCGTQRIGRGNGLGLVPAPYGWEPLVP